MKKNKGNRYSIFTLLMVTNLLFSSVSSIFAIELEPAEQVESVEVIESKPVEEEVESESSSQEESEESVQEEIVEVEESSEELIEVEEESTPIETEEAVSESTETVEEPQSEVESQESEEPVEEEVDETKGLEEYNREEIHALAMELMEEDLQGKNSEMMQISLFSRFSSSTGIGHVDNFLNKIVPYAIEDSKTSGVLPSITIAQGALESAWGLSGLTVNANNLFGIKASNDWKGPVYNVVTGEYSAPVYDSSGKLIKDGYWYETVAGFRKYDSWLGSIKDHGAFFTGTEWRKENYKHVVGEKDYRKAAQALLNAGYATDPGYANKLIAIIESYQLYEHDAAVIIKEPVLNAEYHVQKKGWLSKKGSHLLLGNVGDDLRVEDFRFRLPELKNVEISFDAHIEKRGWINNIKEGRSAGNQGFSRRLEAIKLNLTGSEAQNYNIYYRVYSDTIGWSGWAKNGQPAGTEGYAKKIQSLEVMVTGKGDAPVSMSGTSFRTYQEPSIHYASQLQYSGWIDTVKNGRLSGTIGKARRLEALTVNLSSQPYSGGLSYQTYAQTYGWLPTVSDNMVSGTVGEGKRLEAIKVSLTGAMAQEFDVYYRTHIQTYGWTGWAKNGQPSGSENLSRRLEAVEIRLVKKGRSAPGTQKNYFYK
ncbi:Exo-glucosaminidase LytG [Jeotgalibaca dankookensis]|uniref:Exo-glucosaminidase LytG n=1 Tax=Jeotgalibaca dankookensis TaxID=708126 RepID=A0A1S6IM96_9LACT|nr:glucosaminidase domain-containing protein [Jeotgalibaca dankookensis]AQS52672.1 Exo-glucosaminidase LytG [Jeotgalibaca dankookensis]